MLARSQQQPLEGKEKEAPLPSGGATGDGGTGLGGLNPHLPLPHEVTELGSAMNLQPMETVGGSCTAVTICPSQLSL